MNVKHRKKYAILPKSNTAQTFIFLLAYQYSGDKTQALVWSTYHYYLHEYTEAFSFYFSRVPCTFLYICVGAVVVVIVW
jgi:hypothetical protein